MKKISLIILLLTTTILATRPVSAADETNTSNIKPGLLHSMICGFNGMLTPIKYNIENTPDDPCIQWRSSNVPQNSFAYMGGYLPEADSSGNVYSPGVLGTQGKIVASLLDNQISGQEYIADLFKNIGIPELAPTAYAQGTGYTAMQPFLEFWKIFRNLAYSLYIIMFVVVGIMIMLRTKINAQTVITIQAALPNLLVTLLLITFSYAIVGFMIDIMYFLIYFVVYLIASVGIIDAEMSISRLMSYSAWGVVFEGRNSIITAVTYSLKGVLGSIGTGGLGLATGLVSAADKLSLGMISPLYLFVVIAFIIAMLKLMLALIKSYIMLIVQTITAPLQILMNALPGSKAFSEWLKKTASYLIPFPVAAAMFIFSAILIGNPKDAIVANDWWPGEATSGFGSSPSAVGHQNPFGVKTIADGQDIWLPPFTLTDSLINRADPDNMDVLAIIGFVVFLMTPAAVQMAMDWLQVKESPYTAEAFSSAGMGVSGAMIIPKWLYHHQKEDIQMKRQAALFNNMKTPPAGKSPTNTIKGS